MFGLFGNKNKISYSELTNLINENENLTIIDVRETSEFQTGHVPNAINIPVKIIEFKIDDLNLDKNEKIVLYCLSGGRASVALNTLKAKGYSDVVNFGGVSNWQGDLEK